MGHALTTFLDKEPNCHRTPQNVVDKENAFNFCKSWDLSDLQDWLELVGERTSKEVLCNREEMMKQVRDNIERLERTIQTVRLELETQDESKDNQLNEKSALQHQKSSLKSVKSMQYGKMNKTIVNSSDNLNELELDNQSSQEFRGVNSFCSENIEVVNTEDFHTKTLESKSSAPQLKMYSNSPKSRHKLDSKELKDRKSEEQRLQQLRTELAGQRNELYALYQTLVPQIPKIELQHSLTWKEYMTTIHTINEQAKFGAMKREKLKMHPATRGYKMTRDDDVIAQFRHYQTNPNTILPPLQDHDIDGHTDDNVSVSEVGSEHDSEQDEDNEAEFDQENQVKLTDAEAPLTTSNNTPPATTTALTSAGDPEGTSDTSAATAAPTASVQPGSNDDSSSQQPTSNTTTDRPAEPIEGKDTIGTPEEPIDTVNPAEQLTASNVASIPSNPNRVIPKTVPNEFNPALISPVFFGYQVILQIDPSKSAANVKLESEKRESRLFDIKMNLLQKEMENELMSTQGKINALTQKYNTLLDKRNKASKLHDLEVVKASKELSPNADFFKTMGNKKKQRGQQSDNEDKSYQSQNKILEQYVIQIKEDFNKNKEFLILIRGNIKPMKSQRVYYHEKELEKLQVLLHQSKNDLELADITLLKVKNTHTRLYKVDANARSQLLFAEDQIQKYSKQIEQYTERIKDEEFLLQSAQNQLQLEAIYGPLYLLFNKSIDTSTNLVTLLDVVLSIVISCVVPLEDKVEYLFQMYWYKETSLLTSGGFIQFCMKMLEILQQIGDLKYVNKKMNQEYLYNVTFHLFRSLDIPIPNSSSCSNTKAIQYFPYNSSRMISAATTRPGSSHSDTTIERFDDNKFGLTSYDFQQYLVHTITRSRYLCTIVNHPWPYRAASRYEQQILHPLFQYQLNMISYIDLKYRLAKDAITHKGNKLSRNEKSIIHQRALAQGGNDPLKTNYMKYLKSKQGMSRTLSNAVDLDHQCYKNILVFITTKRNRAALKIQARIRGILGRIRAAKFAQKQAFYHAKGIDLIEKRVQVELQWNDQDTNIALSTVEKMKYEAKIRLRQVQLRTKGNKNINRRQVFLLMMEENVQEELAQVEHRFREMEEYLGYYPKSIHYGDASDLSYIADISTALREQITQAHQPSEETSAILESIKQVAKSKIEQTQQQQASKGSSSSTETSILPNEVLLGPETDIYNSAAATTSDDGGGAENIIIAQLKFKDDIEQSRIEYVTKRRHYLLRGAYPMEVFRTGLNLLEQSLKLKLSYSNPLLADWLARCLECCPPLTELKLQEFILEIPSKRHLCDYIVHFMDKNKYTTSSLNYHAPTMTMGTTPVASKSNTMKGSAGGQLKFVQLVEDLLRHFRFIKDSEFIARCLYQIKESDMEYGILSHYNQHCIEKEEAYLQQFVTTKHLRLKEEIENIDKRKKKRPTTDSTSSSNDLAAARTNSNDTLAQMDMNSASKEELDRLEQVHTLQHLEMKIKEHVKSYKLIEIALYENMKKKQAKIESNRSIRGLDRLNWSARLDFVINSIANDTNELIPFTDISHQSTSSDVATSPSKQRPQSRATKSSQGKSAKTSDNSDTNSATTINAFTSDTNITIANYIEIQNVCHDFLHLASKIAVQIINELYLPDAFKTIPPIFTQRVDGRYDPVRHKRSFYYEAYDIFFKIAIDHHDRFDSDDEFAAKFAAHEVRNSDLYMQHNINTNIIVPLQCTVDYFGYRVLCSSKLPIDLYTYNDKNCISNVTQECVYGSVNQGRTVVIQSHYLGHEVYKITDKLNLTGHYVRGSHDLTAKNIHGPADMVGFTSSISEKYCLHKFRRLMPPEDYEVTTHLPTSTRGMTILWRQLRSEMVRKSKVPLSSDAFSFFTNDTTDWESQIINVKECTKQLISDVIPAFAAILSNRKNYYMIDDIEKSSMMESSSLYDHLRLPHSTISAIGVNSNISMDAEPFLKQINILDRVADTFQSNIYKMKNFHLNPIESLHVHTTIPPVPSSATLHHSHSINNNNSDGDTVHDITPETSSAAMIADESSTTTIGAASTTTVKMATALHNANACATSNTTYVATTLRAAGDSEIKKMIKNPNFNLSLELHRHGINIRHIGLLRTYFYFPLHGTVTLAFNSNIIHTTSDFTVQLRRGWPLHVQNDSFIVSTNLSDPFTPTQITLNKVYMGDSCQDIVAYSGHKHCSEHAEAIRSDLLLSMICRTLKNILRIHLRQALKRCEIGSNHICHAIILHILNNVTGYSDQSEQFWTEQIYDGIITRFGDIAISVVERTNLRQTMFPMIGSIMQYLEIKIGFRLLPQTWRNFHIVPYCFHFTISDFAINSNDYVAIKHNLSCYYYALGKILSTKACMKQVQTYSTLILQDQPTGYWPLQDPKGSHVVRTLGGQSSRSFTGHFTPRCVFELVGPIKNDPMNRCVGFEKDQGSSIVFQPVQNENVYPSLDNIQHMTFEVWCQGVENHNTQRTLLTFGKFTLCILRSNQIAFKMSIQNVDVVVTGDIVQLLEWVYIVGTFDGTNLRIYKNGHLCNTLDVLQEQVLLEQKKANSICNIRENTNIQEAEAKTNCLKELEKDCNHFFNTKQGKTVIKEMASKIFSEHEFKYNIQEQKQRRTSQVKRQKSNKSNAAAAVDSSSNNNIAASTAAIDGSSNDMEENPFSTLPMTPSTLTTTGATESTDNSTTNINTPVAEVKLLLTKMSVQDSENEAKKQYVLRAYTNKIEAIEQTFAQLRTDFSTSLKKEKAKALTKDHTAPRIGSVHTKHVKNGKFFFIGHIAHVAYYQLCLSTDQIKNHYIAGIIDRGYDSDRLFDLANTNIRQALAHGPRNERYLNLYAINIGHALYYTMNQKGSGGGAALESSTSSFYKLKMKECVAFLILIENIFGLCALLKHLPPCVQYSELFILIYNSITQLNEKFFNNINNEDIFPILELAKLPHCFFATNTFILLDSLTQAEIDVYADIIKRVVLYYPTHFGDHLTDYKWLSEIQTSAVVVSIIIAISNQEDMKKLSFNGLKGLTHHDMEVLTKSNRFCLSFNLNQCFNIGDTSIQLIAMRCTQLESLFLNECLLITDQSLFTIAKSCINLRHLEISQCHHVTDYGVEAIARQCHDLRELHLNHLHHVSDDTIATLSVNAYQLTHLEVAYCVQITNQGWIKFGSNINGNSLKYLNLIGCRRILDSGIITISMKCVNLEHIHIGFCSQLTDHGIQYLFHYCLNLQTIHLQELVLLTDFVFLWQRQIDGRMMVDTLMLSKVKHLNVSDCKLLTHTGVAQFCRRARTVESLDISGCHLVHDLQHFTIDISNEEFVGKHLVALDISYCQDVISIKPIYTYCPLLEQFYCTGCVQLTNESVLQLMQHCTHLNILGVGYLRQINDTVLETMAQMLYITELDLTRCSQITDYGVMGLAKECTGLQRLSLNSCKHVSNTSLEQLLLLCSQLIEIDVNFCPQITFKMVQKVKAKGIAIVSSFGFIAKPATELPPEHVQHTEAVDNRSFLKQNSNRTFLVPLLK